MKGVLNVKRESFKYFRKYLLIVLVLCSGILKSQHLVLYMVEHSNKGKEAIAVESFMVTVNDTLSMNLVSQHSGELDTLTLPVGVYKISIFHPEFSPVTTDSLEVGKGTAHINFELKRRSKEEKKVKEKKRQ